MKCTVNNSKIHFIKDKYNFITIEFLYDKKNLLLIGLVHSMFLPLNGEQYKYFRKYEFKSLGPFCSQFKNESELVLVLIRKVYILSHCCSIISFTTDDNWGVESTILNFVPPFVFVVISTAMFVDNNLGETTISVVYQDKITCDSKSGTHCLCIFLASGISLVGISFYDQFSILVSGPTHSKLCSPSYRKQSR